MVKLSFDYDASADCEIAQYRGLTIRAERDCDAGNPWEQWEGNVPLIVSYGRDGLREYDKEAGIDLLRPFRNAISDAMLRRHLKAIAAACDYSHIDLDREAREARYHASDCLTEIKRDLLSDALDGMSNGDKLEALASIYQAIGWPALCTSSQGYSQGDYAELLIVVTPAFRKAMGNTGKHDSAEFWAKDMERAASLYGAWAWGDVYGYVIASDSDDHLSSCWGFYGDDHDESGLAESAIEAADYILEKASKKRADKLKELVSNRVPLALRPALLADASQLEGGY